MRFKNFIILIIFFFLINKMKYYFALFCLFNVYVLSSTIWNVESLTQHLSKILKEGSQGPEFLLIDTNNFIKDKDLGLINAKQNELYKNYNISTYIFVLTSIREGRKTFTTNLVNKLPTLHKKINIDNSIVLVINMRINKTHFIYSKTVTKLFPKKQKKIIRRELFNYLKMKKGSEGIVIVLEKFLEQLKPKSYKNLIIAIIVLVLLTLFIIFRIKNSASNKFNKIK